MPTFFSIFKAELYKSSKNKETYLLLSLCILPVLLATTKWYSMSYEQYVSRATSCIDKNPFVFIYQQVFMIQGALTSILLVGFIYQSLDVEHTAGSWRAMYSIPKMTKYLVWVKQLTLSFWVFVMLQIQFVAIVLVTTLIKDYNQQIPFSDFTSFYTIVWQIQFKVFIGALPFIAFQVWFNLLVSPRILVNLLVVFVSWSIPLVYGPHRGIFVESMRAFHYKVKEVTFLEHYQVEDFNYLYYLLCFVVVSLIGYLLSPKMINKLV